MSENGKDEKVKLKDFSIIELLAKLEKEEDDVKWGRYWEELLQREPFKSMDDCLQDALNAIDELKERVDILQKTLKNHEYLHDNVVVKL